MDLINGNNNSVERTIVFHANFWICFMKIKTISIINPIYIWYRFKKPEGFVHLYSFQKSCSTEQLPANYGMASTV